MTAAGTLFLSRLGRAMVSIDLAPQGDGSRTVCVWTWDNGPTPTQHRPFVVASLEAARDFVPAGALRVLDAPDGFAEEVWMYAGQAVPVEIAAFETEPTAVDAAPDLKTRSGERSWR